MKQSYSTKQRLLASFMALVMCFSMFAGTTLAWFTDTATVGIQNVVTGTLDVDIVDENDNTLTERALNFKKAEGHEDEELLWEPGVTYELEDFYILNKGNLALKYKLYVSGAVGDSTLLDALEFTVKIDGQETTLETFEGHLTARGTATDKSGLVKVYVHMDEEAGNEYQGLKLEGIAITVSAAQDAVEFDSYGNDYDAQAEYSVINYPVDIKYDIPAEKVGPNNQLIEEILIPAANGIYAKLPVGTQLEDGADKLHFTITYLDPESNNITVGDGEVEIPVDVHIGGVSDDNTQPIEIGMGNMMSKGLNMGNYSMKHVENDVPVDMTENDSLNAHNNFTYNPATGDVTIAIATFSEVTAVADNDAKWEGVFDYSWYKEVIAENPNATEFTIANGDQLAAFGAIVGGMNGQAQDSFKGKTIKLISDINLADGEEANVEGKIFYPIGYYNSEGIYERTNTVITSSVASFEGTFDGNGHTISNFYQNTWEMKGDDSYYDKTLQYYNDAMGLFGYVLNGTVKNLTVNNFKSDGEFTPTGVIAAYADGNTTFENIAITNCNPRVYNTGNGGIVGIAGDTNANDDDHLKFNNITVDNSNKISALWGSWDVACGGLVGMYRGNVDASGNATGDTIEFKNCHVAAQIDVYNDVCANYQYYAYRYAGMIIGSVRHNEVKDGKTIPNMTGISASGCTVNYGDWNDYYYCEFEKNSMASYSEDYQFSRVPHSELNFTDSNGNGVVDADERASVTGCNHNHTDAENHRAIYLPFHQLFTGYSWGVNSIGLEKYSGIVTDLGITEGDQDKSVVKFESLIKNDTELPNNKEIKISDLFKAKDGATIVDNAVHITVTDMDVTDEIDISAVYNKDKNDADWTDNTIVLSGKGTATITIQDYNFCTPTTITVEITDRQPAEKFEVAFDHDPDTEGNQNNLDKYLYRVGNKNDVTLSSLFEAIDGEKIGNIDVTVEPVNNTAASGTYTVNASDWTKGTINFDGTGVVKVTIKDDDSFCIPTELLLEVVDATNHVSESVSSLSGNTVLLCNTKLNKNGSLALQNASLYGNGFEINVSEGRITGESVTANYLLYLNNATLDNVQVIGAVYTQYGLLGNSNYNNPTVLALGNSTIVNSYISNSASPVRVRSGNIIIENSTLKGGNFANLDIRGGNITLRDVTTINQLDMNDKASDGTDVLGLGIIVYYEGPSSDTKITIEGNLKQYNSIAENTVFANTYAQQCVDMMFDNDFAEYHYTNASGIKCVNAGIISMTSINVFTADNVDIRNHRNSNDYGVTTAQVRIPGQGYVNGYVYTVKGDSQPLSGNPEYIPSKQFEIVPNVVFDHTVNAYAKQEGSETSCITDPNTGVETITFAEGDSFNWDVNILKSSNKAIDYTVWMNGIQYTDTITFTESGNYTVVFKYSDENNYRLGADGKTVEKYTVNYEKEMGITVSAIEATAKNAVITFPLLESYGTTKVTVDGKTYIMPDLTGTTVPKYDEDLSFDASTRKYGSLKADGKTSVDIYYPIIKTAISGNYMVFPVFGNKNGTLVQIQDYADNGTGVTMTPFNASTQTLPSGLSVSRGYTVQWATDKDTVGSGSMNYGSWANGTLAFKYQSSSDTIACKVMSNYLSYYPDINLRSNDRNEQVMVAEYKYVDNKGDTVYYCVGYHIEERNNGYAFGEKVPESNSGGGTCVTPDTLVTLADGTQKEIQDVTYQDELLVWDFYTGEYTTVPSAIIVNHGYDNWTIIELKFNDGTTVKAVTAHAFFDSTLNDFVLINDSNVRNYLGHDFVKADGDSYSTVKLVDYKVYRDYTESYTLVSAGHYNFITENMFSLTNSMHPLIEGLVVGENMKYDAETLKADIRKYGMYTYDDFKDYVTYEQFIAFNGPYLKVSVEKGYCTFNDILNLIEEYLNN